MVLIFLREPTEERRCSCLIWWPQWKVVRGKKKKKKDHAHAFSFWGRILWDSQPPPRKSTGTLKCVASGCPSRETEKLVMPWYPGQNFFIRSRLCKNDFLTAYRWRGNRFADYLVCETYLFIHFPLVLSLKTVIHRSFASSYYTELAGLYSCN